MDGRGEAPIACTLGSGDFRERLASIAELARDGLLSVRREDLEIELRYAPSVADRICEMVSKEQECCAFLNFAISETSEDVRLTITAPERGRDVAAALFEQFVPPGFVPILRDGPSARRHRSGATAGDRAGNTGALYHLDCS